MNRKLELIWDKACINACITVLLCSGIQQSSTIHLAIHPVAASMRTCRPLTTDIRRWKTGMSTITLSKSQSKYVYKISSSLHVLYLKEVCLIRIRALYAQLLEKDAIIKVMQQRSRREQGRPESQGLRPARSVPSISAVATASSTRAIGEHSSHNQLFPIL